MAKRQGVDVKALSLSLGVTWGASVFLFGLLAPFIGNWMAFVNWLGQFYVGYNATFLGSLVGGIWGFFDAFIGIYVIGWLYQKFKK